MIPNLLMADGYYNNGISIFHKKFNLFNPENFSKKDNVAIVPSSFSWSSLVRTCTARVEKTIEKERKTEVYCTMAQKDDVDNRIIPTPFSIIQWTSAITPSDIAF